MSQRHRTKVRGRLKGKGLAGHNQLLFYYDNSQFVSTVFGKNVIKIEWFVLKVSFSCYKCQFG